MTQQIKITKIIAYYRVSTPRQGETGFGVEAQKIAVKQLAREKKVKIVKEYREVESGRRSERPELAKAIAHTKSINGTLVIAKLDRLSRNASFILNLMDSEVNFVCCDNPYANRLTIQILAAVAEQEAVAISTRTREALAVVKSRGVKLGSARPDHWKGREHLRGWRQATKRSAIRRRETAIAKYNWVLPDIQEWREKESLTYQEIATRLNERGSVTSTGGKFTATTVWRILKGYPKPKKHHAKAQT
jgi:DNA invertase Pin-like site-specific DNA recombinase